MPTVEPVAAEIVDEKLPVPVTVKFPDANVPVVDRFSLSKVIVPLESVILPSARVRLPTVEPVAVEIVDEKLPVPVTVKLPDANVPVVDRFSLPKLIAPLESVILPSANVRLPTVEPVAVEIVDEKLPVPVTVKLPDANVPVVDRFSLPKLIAPLESVILPSARVMVPNVEPVAAEIVDVKVPVVDTFKLLQVTPAALKSASVSVKFPELPPVAAVVATVNVSSLSSQPIKAFVKSPLSITIPQSLLLLPVVLLFNSIKLSRITVFVDVITSPVTSRPPVIYTLPSVSILKSAVSGSPFPECILKALASLVSIPTVQIFVLLTFKLKTTSPSDLSNVKPSDCKLPD